MVEMLIELLKIMGLIIVVLLAAGVILLIAMCIVFVLKEVARVWKAPKK